MQPLHICTNCVTVFEVILSSQDALLASVPWACQAPRLSAGAASPHHKRTRHASVLGTCVLADTSHGGLRSTARFVFAQTAPVGKCTARLASLANQQETVIHINCTLRTAAPENVNHVGPALLGKGVFSL